MIGVGIYLYRQGNTAQIYRSKAVEQQFTGRLHIQGTDLYDSAGNKVRLTGIQIQKLVPIKAGKKTQCYEDPPDDEINNIASLGFNVSTIQFTWANLEKTPPTKNPDGTWNHQWDQNYLNALDHTIQRLSDKNIYVMLRWRSGWGLSNGDNCPGGGIPLWLFPGINFSASKDQLYCDFFLKPDHVYPGVSIGPQEGTTEVWKFIANRYKNNLHFVATDLISEPYPVKTLCTSDQLRDPLMNIYKRFGAAVRTIIPDILLVFEDSSDVAAKKGEFTLNGPIPFQNSVYSYHLYQTTWDGAKQVTDAFWNRAKSWNMPLWLGEFHAVGYSSAQSATPTWQADTTQLMSYLKQLGISWEITDYGGCCGIVKNGQLYWDYIHILQSGFDTPPQSGTITPPSGTITPPTVTPTVPVTQPQAGNVTIALKLKFQGIVAQPATKTMQVKVMAVRRDFSSAPATGTFTADSSGVWSGTVTLTLPQGPGYYLLLKGPMHIQKKVCEARPTETAPGTYSCSDGALSFASTNSFDFSGVLQLTGDLSPQDGIVDSYDISLVRNNLHSKDARLLLLADLNLDGIIDSQDYSLLISSLSVKSDEE